jgi:hypothetical protein
MEHGALPIATECDNRKIHSGWEWDLNPSPPR